MTTLVLNTDDDLIYVMNSILGDSCMFKYNLSLQSNYTIKKTFDLKEYYMLTKNLTSNSKEIVIAKKSTAQTMCIADFLQVLMRDAEIFYYLTAALKRTGLTNTLSGSNEPKYTLFAPNDKAFITLLEKNNLSVNDLLENPSLRNILLNHVLEGSVLSNDLHDGQIIKTISGATYKITIDNSVVKINDAKVLLSDIHVRNGVVHVIDTVLASSSELSEVPPTLSPPAPITTTVVDLILQSPDHTTLAQALQVQAADLITTLQSEGPFTVFAPTNKAFTAYLTTNNMKEEDLLNSPNLGEILTYHVLSGKVMASNIINYNNASVPTLQGENLSITGVMINNATVIVPDNMVNNGVVHVIDALLIPPSMITPAPTPAAPAPTPAAPAPTPAAPAPTPAAPAPATPAPAPATPATPAPTSTNEIVGIITIIEYNYRYWKFSIVYNVAEYQQYNISDVLYSDNKEIVLFADVRYILNTTSAGLEYHPLYFSTLNVPGMPVNLNDISLAIDNTTYDTNTPLTNSNNYSIHFSLESAIYHSTFYMICGKSSHIYMHQAFKLVTLPTQSICNSIQNKQLVGYGTSNILKRCSEFATDNFGNYNLDLHLEYDGERRRCDYLFQVDSIINGVCQITQCKMGATCTT